MLQSLRSRLILSYLVVLAALVLVLVGALLATAALSRANLAQTAIELGAIARPAVASIARSLGANAVVADFTRQIDAVAADADVRMLWVDGRLTVLHDSAGEWQGETLPASVAPRRAAELTDALQRFVAPDGQRWLFYTPPSGNLGRSFLVLARTEPPLTSFLNSILLAPLWQSLLVALAVAVLLALLIARSVARPLQQIAAAANAVARGRYDHVAPLSGPTEVRDLAASFNAMAAQVQRSQQAQRDFVANVSHDLRTPITAIQGWSQALLDGTLDDEVAARQAATIIHAEAARMARQVQQLLALARIDAGQLALRRVPVDVAALLAEVQAAFQPQAQQAGIALALHLPADLPPLLADRDRLVEMLGNLLDNALAHTPDGGHVALAAARDGAMLALQVRDSGPGVAPAEQARIFERFYQADRARARSATRGGTGLGLAIVRDLATAHGGTIDVESAPGAGATFTLRLPCVNLPLPPTTGAF